MARLPSHSLLLPMLKTLIVRNHFRHIYVMTVDEIWQHYSEAVGVPTRPLQTLCQGVDGRVDWRPISAVQMFQKQFNDSRPDDKRLAKVYSSMFKGEDHVHRDEEDEEDRDGDEDEEDLELVPDLKAFAHDRAENLESAQFDLLPYLYSPLGVAPAELQVSEDGWISLHEDPCETRMQRFYSYGSESFKSLARVTASYASVSAFTRKNLMLLPNPERNFLELLASDISQLCTIRRFNHLDIRRTMAGILLLGVDCPVLQAILRILCGQKKESRRIPSFVFTSWDSDKADFLAGLLRATSPAYGNVYDPNKVQFVVNAPHRAGVCLLLRNLGVPFVQRPAHFRALPGRLLYQRDVILGSSMERNRINATMRDLVASAVGRRKTHCVAYQVDVPCADAVADGESLCFLKTGPLHIEQTGFARDWDLQEMWTKKK